MSPSCDSTAPLSFTCDGYNLRTTCEALVAFYEGTVGCSWTSGYDGYVARRGLEDVAIDPENIDVTIASTGTQTWFSGTPSGGQQDPFCDWYGVTCENTSCTVGCDVVKIDLWNNGLRGSLPEALNFLYNLENLELGRNNIRGTIPDTYGLLPKLTVLLLDDNELTGTYNDSANSAICALIESGQLEQFWTDCDDGYEVECDCCTSCGAILAPSESPSISVSPSDIPAFHRFA